MDKKYKKRHMGYFLVFILLLYIPVAAYLGSIKDIGEQLKITIPFFALIVAFFALIDRETDEGSIQGNYKKLSKDKTMNKGNTFYPQVITNNEEQTERN